MAISMCAPAQLRQVRRSRPPGPIVGRRLVDDRTPGAYNRGMQTWDAIRARRNVRQYTDQPLARQDLERILEAGRRAPSSINWQPWDFVVITDRDQLVELAKVWEHGKHIA